MRQREFNSSYRLDNSKPSLFVDATGVLASFGSPPTGIPRVERFLIDAALSDPDGTVTAVRYDRRRRRFRELNAFERKQLLSDLDLTCCEFRNSSTATIVARAMQVVRENPAIGRDADRHFGNLAAGRRDGLAYSAFKTLFRVYRIYRKIIAAPRLFLATKQARNIDAGAGMVLLSNPTVLGSFVGRAVKGTKRTAVICHDLIPMIRPDLTIDAAHARRFSTNFAKLFRSRPVVLCTSQAAVGMVNDLLRNMPAVDLRVARFPMPSVLLEHAKQRDGASKRRAAKPFVFYCSTIEARKNHLLLAQVWQKSQAEGVVLPKLVCAGKWGWGVDELVEFLARHPTLASSIDFVGPIGDDELVEYYRSALFGVVPSRIEGWGYCASECLDFGLPVIIATDPALREATRGMMPAIDPDDVDGWYREIRRMTEDENYRLSLHEQIAAKHRPTPSAASFAAIKKALLDPSPSECATDSVEMSVSANKYPLIPTLGETDSAVHHETKATI